MYKEFSIKIDFDKEVKERPERVFESMSLFIQGFNEINSELIHGFGKTDGIETALSKTREGSLIADLGQYFKEKSKSVRFGNLLDSIYFGLENTIIDTEKVDSENDVKGFIEKVYEYRASNDQDYNEFMFHAEPDNYKIAKGLKKISEGLDNLAETDEALIGRRNEFVTISKNFKFPRTPDELFGEEITSHPSRDILIIKRPDYVGNSKWDFISSKRNKQVSAKILHKEWLESWRDHGESFWPGDALLVLIKTDRVACGKDGSVKYEDEVTEVVKIIPQKEILQYKIELDEKN